VGVADAKYCPRCGGPLAPRRFHGERVTHPACQRCGFVLWQNPKPVVAALVTRQDEAQAQVLLGRRGLEPGRGLWHVPGGFVDPDETPEEALARECAEELGVQVEPEEFVGGFPDRYGDEPILVLAYRCRLVGGEPEGSTELDQPTWFPVNRPPQLAFRSCQLALQVLLRKLQGGG